MYPSPSVIFVKTKSRPVTSGSAAWYEAQSCPYIPMGIAFSGGFGAAVRRFARRRRREVGRVLLGQRERQVHGGDAAVPRPDVGRRAHRASYDLMDQAPWTSHRVLPVPVARRAWMRRSRLARWAPGSANGPMVETVPPENVVLIVEPVATPFTVSLTCPVAAATSFEWATWMTAIACCL